MATGQVLGQQYFWIVLFAVVVFLVLFLIVIVIALFSKQNVNTSGRYGLLGFSLEANNDKPPTSGGL